VLEGSVRKSGERVRITAQLVDVSDGAHIWSETYDRTMTDIFAVQDDVAAAIIDALQIHVGANPTRGRPTESPVAYALFLKARASFNAVDSRDAEEFLLQAIELDPNFAEAYELLAYCYWELCGSGFKGAEGQKLMGEAAAKALAINPDLVFAQALYQSGNIETYSYLGEIEALERAAREEPGKTGVLFALAYDLLEAGYLREALGVAERFVDLDPLSPPANFNLAAALYAVGRTSESLAALDLAAQLDHDFATWVIGNVNLVEKQDDIAIAHFEAYLEQGGLPSNWVRELVTGARDPATGQAYLDRRIPEIIASMPEEDAVASPLSVAIWHLYFGFLDRHFELILDLDLSDSTWTDVDQLIFVGTLFRRLGVTAHPKYLEVAEAVGIVDVWEQRGPPDFCEKVDGQWVCE
jgi:tetratricopeptide (TPR) repeat protein